METLFIAGVAVGSSLVLLVLARGVLRLPARAVRAAGTALLEFVALWVVCFGANLALGLLLALFVRTLTSRFISVYIVHDPSLAVISAVQAFVGYWWARVDRP